MKLIDVVVKGYPPNIETIEEFIPEARKHMDNGAVCCYGNAIYNPSGKAIPPDLLYHESVHADRQHKMSTVAYFNKYLTNKAFRLDEEVIAYAAQYAYIKENTTIKPDLVLEKMAKALSSSLYGLEITTTEAKKLIRQQAKSWKI